MAKKRVGKFPKAFRQMAVDRLNHCENIVELAKELGISRRLLYGWREKLEPLDCSGAPPANAREATLRKEVSRLKRVLAEKVLEVDFFTGALQQVEARRQQSGKAGGFASHWNNRGPGNLMARSHAKFFAHTTSRVGACGTGGSANSS